jgi:hypothetical protein
MSEDAPHDREVRLSPSAHAGERVRLAPPLLASVGASPSWQSRGRRCRISLLGLVAEEGEGAARRPETMTTVVVILMALALGLAAGGLLLLARWCGEVALRHEIQLRRREARRKLTKLSDRHPRDADAEGGRRDSTISAETARRPATVPTART